MAVLAKLLLLAAAPLGAGGARFLTTSGTALKGILCVMGLLLTTSGTALTGGRFRIHSCLFSSTHTPMCHWYCVSQRKKRSATHKSWIQNSNQEQKPNQRRSHDPKSGQRQKTRTQSLTSRSPLSSFATASHHHSELQPFPLPPEPRFVHTLPLLVLWTFTHILHFFGLVFCQTSLTSLHSQPIDKKVFFMFGFVFSD